MTGNGDQQCETEKPSLALLGALASAARLQPRRIRPLGAQVYEEHCATCHGEKLRSTGAMPDLRDLARTTARSSTRWCGRPWTDAGVDGIVSPQEIDQLWAYIRFCAR